MSSEPSLDLWSNAVLVVAADFASIGVTPSMAIRSAAAAIGVPDEDLEDATIIERRLHFVLDAFTEGVAERAGRCPLCGDWGCRDLLTDYPEWAFEWSSEAAALMLEQMSWAYPEDPSPF